ncbi:MAG: RidA family protein [Thermodesulfobacteriota bacterium]
MKITEVISENAAKPFGVFSQAIKAGNFIFVSGQVSKDRNGRVVGKGDIKAQTEQCILNLQNILEAAGTTLRDVVKVTVFVADMSHLAAIHEVRARYFTQPYPASTLVEVSRFTEKDYLIEIEAIALC